MKLTIITEDNNVGKDGWFYPDLDLTSCGIPSNVWALQWDNDSGHIEYKGAHIQNETITELPTWANEVASAWQVAEEVKLAAAAAAAAEEAETNETV